MSTQLLNLKLPAALDRRLREIAEAGVLGRTIEEVISHFIREALHRDWLTQEVQRDRLPPPAPPAPRPLGRPRAAEVVPSHTQRTEKRLMRMPEVCHRIGTSRSTLYKMLGQGGFPTPKRLGGRTVAWLESDVDAWIDSRTTSGVS